MWRTYQQLMIWQNCQLFASKMITSERSFLLHIMSVKRSKELFHKSFNLKIVKRKSQNQTKKGRRKTKKMMMSHQWTITLISRSTFCRTKRAITLKDIISGRTQISCCGSQTTMGLKQALLKLLVLVYQPHLKTKKMPGSGI